METAYDKEKQENYAKARAILIAAAEEYQKVLKEAGFTLKVEGALDTRCDQSRNRSILIWTSCPEKSEEWTERSELSLYNRYGGKVYEVEFQLNAYGNAGRKNVRKYKNLDAATYKKIAKDMQERILRKEAAIANDARCREIALAWNKLYDEALAGVVIPPAMRPMIVSTGGEPPPGHVSLFGLKIMDYGHQPFSAYRFTVEQLKTIFAGFHAAMSLDKRLVIRVPGLRRIGDQIVPKYWTGTWATEKVTEAKLYDSEAEAQASVSTLPAEQKPRAVVVPYIGEFK